MATMKLVLVLMMTTIVAVWARDPELTNDFAVPVGMNASEITGDFFTFTGLRNFSAAPNTFGSKKVTQGRVHFQINMSKKRSVLAISAFGSSNAGTISLPKNIFGSGIKDEVLLQAFKINSAELMKLKAPFMPTM
ncbi:hypothetical protein AXG93_1953s1250 [Marchantia polymorpha subsp. ruderalis]|uniref:Cupin type-1 domain-containing protein n=1 Tax=Marchantia polymorpha subsp. ruderalis TaxID=1480154 RepID=A0A176VSV6_MARPO|nr:hypothetical protein AXG93_1953s1250 [Marchantia polymorpha subsp. ruderalis]